MSEVSERVAPGKDRPVCLSLWPARGQLLNFVRYLQRDKMGPGGLVSVSCRSVIFNVLPAAPSSSFPLLDLRGM